MRRGSPNPSKWRAAPLPAISFISPVEYRLRSPTAPDTWLSRRFAPKNRRHKFQCRGSLARNLDLKRHYSGANRLWYSVRLSTSTSCSAASASSYLAVDLDGKGSAVQESEAADARFQGTEG